MAANVRLCKKGLPCAKGIVPFSLFKVWLAL
jgi:hypothetical protein